MLFFAKSKDNYYKTTESCGGMTIIQHCIDVGLVCKCLLMGGYTDICGLLSRKLNCSSSQVVSLFSYFASVHDVGKLSVPFQFNFVESRDYMRKEELVPSSILNNYNKEEYKRRHEVISRKILQEVYKGVYSSSPLLKSFLFAISSHHEKDNNTTRRFDDLYTEKGKVFFKKEQENLIKELSNVFSFDINSINVYSKDYINVVSTIFLGFLFLSDWIASSEYLNNNIDLFNNLYQNNEIDKYIEIRYEQISNILKENLGIIKRNSFVINSYADIFGSNDYVLRPIQKVVEDVLQEKDKKFKFVLIEAPMGEGKTEAALRAASLLDYNKKGVFFGLPTGVTTSMMYERLSKIFKNQNCFDLNVVYSNGFLEDKMYKNTIKDDFDFLSPNRMGLMVGSVVGTVDQAMKSVLKNKFALLGLVGLMNKVLIIDEVHAYEAYMQGILGRLLAWCNALEIPVVLLSATMPKKLKEEYIKEYLDDDSIKLKSDAYPLITVVDSENQILEVEVEGSYIYKNIEYKFLRETEDKTNILDVIKSSIAHGENIGFVCNTIKDSKAWAEMLKPVLKNYEVMLINSNFLSKDRADKENLLKNQYLGKVNRKQNLIVIGTQVLEQSLDIDFDCLITYNAPIDLLLQRIGRWHRFDIQGRKSNNNVYVILPENKCDYSNVSYKMIYNNYILEQTENFLLNNPTCVLPQDFRKSIESVYTFNNTAEALEKMVEDEEKKILSFGSVIDKPMKESFHRINAKEFFTDNADFGYFSTRMGEKRGGVIMISEEEVLAYSNEFKKYSLSDLANPIVDKNFAKYLLGFSMQIPCYNMIPSEIVSDKIIEGRGYLKGYIFYILSKNHTLEINEEIIEGKEKKAIYLKYQYNQDYGLSIER